MAEFMPPSPPPTSTAASLRRRRPLTAPPPPPHHRIVLLFDLDAFYAQTERVRLGLGLDASVALLQWNSVLAVTYPAREYGIQRGDSWEAVAAKSNHKCIAIHLPILPIIRGAGNDNKNSGGNEDDGDGIIAAAEDEEEADSETTTTINSNNNTHDGPSDKININIDEAAFEKEFRLSPEERDRILKVENGVQKSQKQGKASLERYRLASRVIFATVLESLKGLLGNKRFVLEKASIDEFYLDVTEYCYKNTDGQHGDSVNNRDDAGVQTTKVVGDHDQQLGDVVLEMDDPDDVELALVRACQLSAWVRSDVWKKLGFTMSAGISTNKMMAKLTASFGKPNGQAVLHPKKFAQLMSKTKVRKVRNFGGKLGNRVLELLHAQRSSSENMEDFASNATMQDLAQIPLTVWRTTFSVDTAHFIFQACQGIDNEPVNETSGALVKSITAFKSFTANKNHGEVLTWLKLLAKEIVERVEQDAARNHRYPKTCTLNYTYYTTANGQRPRDRQSARTQRQSRSHRLMFPAERESIAAKSESLVEQAMAKLGIVLKEHPLRGVGLAASNFEFRGQPPEGNTSIESFFSVGPTKNKNEDVIDKREASASGNKRQRVTAPHSQPDVTLGKATQYQSTDEPVDNDLELAKKLQASYDRENYVLSKVASSRPTGTVATKRANNKPKTKRIDSFFAKR